MFEEIANLEDYLRNKMTIKIVFGTKYKNKIKYNNIICPQCNENIKMDIKNYKINLFECKNNHRKENILFNEFRKSQKLNNWICDICKNPKKKLSDNNNTFFKCLTCNKIICSLCQSYHCLTHDLTFYEDHYYSCLKNEKKMYIAYCEDCRQNLCKLCEYDIKHKKINFVDILPDKNRLNQLKNELKTYIHLFKNDINMIINMLNDIKSKINQYYKINEDIINAYNENNTNYEILYYLNKFTKDQTIKDLRKIVEYNTVLDKFYDIFTLYKKMNIDEISLIYKVKDKKEVKLFDAVFTRNYKKFCKIIVDGKEKDLKEFYSFGKIFATNKETFEIKLKGITNITNMSYMFYWCNNLIGLPDFYKWNTTTITNMNHLFYSCESLTLLPDISNLNTSNVGDMNNMFNNCIALQSLPDISKWDTSNVINMEYMFGKCSSLNSLPDISKWNISNVENLSNMFCLCTSLSSLPNISKWDTSNVTNMSYLFSNCGSLLSIPDISKWNISKVSNFNGMFTNCKLIKSLSNLSKWDLSNIKQTYYMFDGCVSLKEKPYLFSKTISNDY